MTKKELKKLGFEFDGDAPSCYTLYLKRPRAFAFRSVSPELAEH